MKTETPASASIRRTVALAVFLLLATAAGVDAGTRIRIRGVPGKSEGQIIEMLGGRLEFIIRNPATPSRADDAAFLMRQMLERDGYDGVAVNWKIVSPSEIVLTASGARRLSLGDVTITGCDPKDARRLSRLFSAPADKDSMPGMGKPPFREPDVATGLSYLVQDYQARGYWAATATVECRHTDPHTGVVSLSIAVKPGPLHTLAAAVVAAGGEPAARRVTSTAAPWLGKPATTANLNAMRSAVEDSFRKQGFANARIAMGSRIETPRFVPEFSVTEGKRLRLHRVTATGFEKTNPARVEGRMKDLEGGWYDTTEINRRIRGFLATGAFAGARVETVPASDGAVDAILHFKEGKARELTLSAGASSYEGPIFRALYGNRNIYGQLLGLSTGVEISGRGLLGDVRLTDPWLFGTEWAGSARLYSVIYGHEGYDSFETGLEGTLSRKFENGFSMEYLLGLSGVNNSSSGLPAYAMGDKTYQHTRLRATPVWDRRDNAMVPTTGWYLKAPLQIGAAIGSDTAGYVSLGAHGGIYHTLTENWQVDLLGQFGFLVPTGDATDFPIDLRYFNGGANTVRSFRERDLGPTANGYAIGGNAYWAANAEIIRKIAGPLKAVGFLDAGAISPQYSGITSADVEFAIGLGLRVDLPIGAVRLEYGRSLNRNPGDPLGAFHFAIGASF